MPMAIPAAKGHTARYLGPLYVAPQCAGEIKTPSNMCQKCGRRLLLVCDLQHQRLAQTRPAGRPMGSMGFFGFSAIPDSLGVTPDSPNKKCTVQYLTE